VARAGPTLAAMLQTFIGKSRATGRALLVIMAPGFHFVSQAPFDAGSMMASFLPQVNNSFLPQVNNSFLP
jgi:hypothetical protein